MTEANKYQTSFGRALEQERGEKVTMLDKEKISDNELVSMVKLRGIKVSQLYNIDSLLEDPDVQKRIDTEVDYKLWLRDQEAEEEINKEMDKEIEEDKKLKDENNENELIPNDKPKILTEEEKRQQKIDNELVPDSKPDDSGDSENELIPD